MTTVDGINIRAPLVQQWFGLILEHLEDVELGVRLCWNFIEMFENQIIQTLSGMARLFQTM